MMSTDILKLVGFMPRAQQSMIMMPWLVGQFVMEWAKHERIVGALIATMEERPYEDVISELLDGQVSEYARRLRAGRDGLDAADPARSHIDLALAAHEAMYAVRNDINHGWFSGISEDQDFVHVRKLRKKPATARPLSLEEMIEHVNSLNRANLLAMSARDVLRGNPPIPIGQPEKTQAAAPPPQGPA